MTRHRPMIPKQISDLQRVLLEEGFYDGALDGIWGPKSHAAMEAATAAIKLRQECTLPQDAHIPGSRPMAWGSRVSKVFRDRVRWIANDLEIDVDWLMACMAFESAETFDAGIRNGAGSGAVGLIQFMPKTAEELGTTAYVLARMSAEDQLNYVYKYFRPYRGRLRTLSDVYMAILWPAAIGKPESHVLWTSNTRPTTYRQNAGLDADKDLRITKEEAASKVAAKLRKGQNPDIALA